ncbi:MAG: outer membrane beta-barrel protein [Alphaproteobacteria bacterium]|nr:outer membrane beta-barrel protein [Alphaproteobacteria bacterium]
MRVLVSLLAATALTSPALAAESNSILSNIDFHIGANGGGLMGDSHENLYSWEGTDTGVVGNSDSAFFLGAQVGADYRFGRFFVGIEGDYQETNYSAQSPNRPYTSAQVGQDVEGFFTVRLRAGGNLDDDTKLFGSVGLAYTREKVRLRDETTHVADTDKVTGDGWSWGLGLEHMLDEHWSARIEYLHIHTTSNAHTYLVTEDEDYYSHNKFDAGLVRIGVDYHFDSP